MARKVWMTPAPLYALPIHLHPVIPNLTAV
jgi:hypothetical protein